MEKICSTQRFHTVQNKNQIKVPETYGTGMPVIKYALNKDAVKFRLDNV